MAWAYLILAGLFEIVFASTLKLAEGFTKPLATVVFLVSIVASFLLLSRAARGLPIGTALRCGPASAPRVRSLSA
ncbi:MAG: DMT family transporter [Methyloceanibacter sp.]|jgi:quaternary ammonium compound-resistance protein SugE